MKKSLLMFMCMCCASSAMAEAGVGVTYQEKTQVIETEGKVDVTGPGEFTLIKTDGGSDGVVLHTNEKHSYDVKPGDKIIKKDLSVHDTGVKQTEPVQTEPARAEPAPVQDGPKHDRDKPRGGRSAADRQVDGTRGEPMN